MPVHPQFLSVIKPNPPPLWYVTNGEVTVGPVVTTLLVRGVEAGRVPEDCRVSSQYGRWRPLESVREIAAKKRPATSVAEAAEAFRELARPGERIRDQDELCHHVTRLAMVVTGADSAMFHLRYGFRHFSTRAVLGAMPEMFLPESLPETDLVLRSALLGRAVTGSHGPAEEALARRFAASSGGVGGAAMLPIFVGNSLMAMLELSRAGHPFRRADLRRAERIAQRALFQNAN